MSLDKLIAAATDYFLTGADVHRRALAGGGGKITDLSDKSGHFGTPTTATADVVSAPKKVDTKAAKTQATVEEKAAETVITDRHTPAADPASAAVEDKTARDDYFGPQVNDAISYEEDIRPLLRAKSLANRDALVALLGKFGVKSGQELTADQYPAFLAGLKAL